MDVYIRRFCTVPYAIPDKLHSSLHHPWAQIVAAWFVIQRQTGHTYVSLGSCRAAIAPGCSWDNIGLSLQLLLNTKTVPDTLLPLQAIGHGNTTVVVGHSGTGSLIAIKQHVFSRGSWEISTHILGELLALQELRVYTWTPNIVFHEISQDMVQIGMEYLPLSMRQMVRFGRSRQLCFGRRLIRQLLGAVSLLHDLNRAHRDIKPDNIRFRSNGELVLIDYDSCIVLGPHIEKTRRVCTANYRDPFLFDADVDLSTYDYRSLDAYSVGVVILFILHGGRHAFMGHTDHEIVQSMRTYELSGVFSRLKLPEEDRVVIRGLLKLDPRTRMTLTEANDAYKNIE